ncbi:hypothetical protein WJX73_007221 [Symbiochloris irregularis]|uniref:Phosphodiesterase n=1 Tax=Symbiochloris irregularis TaxID=706552 RepID=A0AAW1P7W9_9CHLO
MADAKATAAVVEYTRALIKKFVAEAEAEQQWVDGSLQVLLLGRQRQVSDGAWTLSSLDDVFGPYHLPCFVIRPSQREGGARNVIWGNPSAYKLLGKPRTAAGVQAVLDAMPTLIRIGHLAAEDQLHESLQIDKGRMRGCFDISKGFAVYWDGTPPTLYVRERVEAIQIEVDGKVLGCELCAVEQMVNAEQMRSSALVSATPIHSYMFSAEGKLLYATSTAVAKLKAQGRKVHEVLLQDLLVLNGVPQEDLALSALQAICVQHQRHFAVTLAQTLPCGSVRHTLYEMWPTQDPANLNACVLVVSCFDVTSQKRTELELQAMKGALQRHNNDLRQKVEEATEQRARLEADRTALQDQLRTMQHQPAPRTRFDATSPVDKAVALLDGLLAGTVPDVDSVLALRNLLLQSPDPRQLAHDLRAQLAGQTGLGTDIERSLVDMLQMPSPSIPVMRAQSRKSLNGSEKATGMQETEPATDCLEGIRQVNRKQLTELRQIRSVKERSVKERDPLRKPSFASSPLAQKSSHDFARTESRGHAFAALCLPEPSVCTEVERLLAQAHSDWGFDLMVLDSATGGHCLSCFGFWLLQQSGLMTRFCIPEARMASALRALENGYQTDTPYHNRVHVASVMHMTHMIVHAPRGLRDSTGLSEELELALYLAAACHDYEHPGVTNDFLIKSGHDWALTHNDQSPLESHHASCGFKVLHKHLFSTHAEWNIEGVDQVLRPVLIKLILGTDMKQHFSIVSRFQGALRAGVFDHLKRPSFDHSANKLSTEHMLLTIQVALKCADLGHVTLPWTQHRDWVQRLQLEFFEQGDRERAAGLPVSALMDRHKGSELSGGQVGFFEVVALPMLRSLAAVVPAAEVLLVGASDNYLIWRSENEMSGPRRLRSACSDTLAMKADRMSAEARMPSVRQSEGGVASAATLRGMLRSQLQLSAREPISSEKQDAACVAAGLPVPEPTHLPVWEYDTGL